MYIFQLITNDTGLQLITEVIAETIETLQFEAQKKVKRYPQTRGMKYGVWEIVKTGDKFDYKTLKTDTISN